MDPITAAAVIGGGFGLFNNILGRRSSDKSQARDRAFAQQQYRDQMRATYGHEMTVVGDASPEIYGGKGSDLLGRDRDLEYSGKHLDQVFETGAKHGLTPQEVAGSPAAGGTGRSGGNAVLGQSNAAASANLASFHNANADRATQERIASMRARTDLAIAGIQSGVTVLGQGTQAATQRRGQDLQADVQTQVAQIAARAGNYNARQISSATRAAAAMSASATRYASDNALRAADLTSGRTRMSALDQLARQRLVDAAQIDQIAAATGLALQDARFKADLHDERWERLFSTMGPDNVAASVLANMYGLDIEMVLKGQALDQGTEAQLRAYIRHSLASDSFLFRELVGGDMAIDQAGSVTERNWRGRPPSRGRRGGR